MTARTPEGDGSGYFLRNHFDVRQLDTQRIAREAIRRALRSRNPRPLEPGTTRSFSNPRPSPTCSGVSRSASTRGRADEGRSRSRRRAERPVGEKLFDERISILSDPWQPELARLRRRRRAGIPAEGVYLVRNGVLENLTYSRFWAQQKGRQPTPGPVNAIIESAAAPSTSTR